ncbi:MAG: LLM class flavin-dependent oxidoreductase, partial [Caulobacteraceae bacterium]|nr:LLM class flavin-dependent oxidoreductase [Caulobacteraceae bacterium]
MKFGVTIPTSLIDPKAASPYAKVYDYLREVEDLGYEFAAVGHHRFNPELAFGEPSAPFVTFAALLARTSRLKMVSSIVLVATYHPLEVAEQVNTLAELSGGRFILGSGMGYRAYEFEAVGLDFSQRVSRYGEALQVIERALEGQPFSFTGKHFNFTDVQVTPQPYGGRRTPIWLGASQPPGIKRAATR